jgi:AmmeMemoRadiSam system protein B
MPIVFAAITPHPPVLIPTIGKDAIKKIEKTKKSMERLEEDLYAAKPDILIIISPHGSYFKTSFTVNVCPEYETDLKEFGDLATKLKFKGELQISSRIIEATKAKKIPAVMISEPKLDYGSSVPLYYLANHIKNIQIIQIGFCDLNWKTHVDFGYLIKDIIMHSNKRVAVIASGDLSHALTSDSPAGFNKLGAKFDEKIQELLSHKNIAGMLQMDEKFIDEASECGFRAFLILMGVMKNMQYDYKFYSYEFPFGIGYLAANLVI